MTKEKLAKSPWTISIGTAIFSLLLTMGYDYSKSKPILTTVWLIICWIGTLLWQILNFELKVWWIIVSIVLFILAAIVIEKLKNEEEFKPDFCSYREGKFKRWKWTWNWEWSSSKKVWLIINMKVHCPNCDTPMIEHSSVYGLSFDCPRCDFKATDGQCDEPHKIESIIIDNIKRAE